MYIKIPYTFQSIPDTQSRVITKVYDFLGQPSYLFTTDNRCKRFATLMVFLEEFFEKGDFETHKIKSANYKTHEKIPSIQSYIH